MSDLHTPAAPRGETIHQPTKTLGDLQTMKGRIDRLLATRSDWGEERQRHKFLLDAYAGTGGFQGKVRLPFRSYWGWAADVYRTDLPLALDETGVTEDGIHTYLDRFDREEIPKFQKRVNMSHYPNYVATFIDVPISYMFRRPFPVKPAEDEAGKLGEWTNDADGAGTNWNDIVRDTIAPRAAVLGWCPVLFDLPSNGTRQQTAFDDSRSKTMPYAIPLFPSNILDWSHDENGVLQWAKIRTDYVDRADPLELGQDVTRITLWSKEGWQWFEIVIDSVSKRATIRDMQEGAHPFGVVPLMIMRRKPIPDDPFRGIPLASSASDEARRMFNYISELDDFMRACAFAFLEFPSENPEQSGGKLLGNGRGLPVKPEWGNTHRWVGPDTAVAEMYEKRVANTIEEMYRAQKMEFTRGQKGGNARSGLSQAFEFEAANRAIAEFARMLARFDQASRRLVASVVAAGMRETAITTTAPKRFDVEEMAKEMDEALSAVSLKLGPTAEAEIKKKVVRGILPQLDEEKWKTIEEEIDEMAEVAAQNIQDLAAADIREARQALKGNRDDPEDILDDQEEAKQKPPAGQPPGGGSNDG